LKIEGVRKFRKIKRGSTENRNFS